MSPVRTVVDARASRFPRVSGDEPYQIWSTPWSRLFSPRERG